LAAEGNVDLTFRFIETEFNAYPSTSARGLRYYDPQKHKSPTGVAGLSAGLKKEILVVFSVNHLE
jgi:hypothetical protein